ncbi:hypothetical protein ACN47E_003052 [Coniothyrium glycines]
MPPDRGRASRACAACRKQKTRCYETANGRACLRCDRLGQSCSLDEHQSPELQRVTPHVLEPRQNIHGDTIDNSRLDRLESAVRTLLQRVEDLEGGATCTVHRQSDVVRRQANAAQTGVHQDVESQDEVEKTSAPLFVLRDVTSETGLRPADRTASNTPTRNLANDIIIKRLINPQEAFELLTIFQEHYGRWLSFDAATPTAILLEDVRNSPLLLTACCLIAARHVSQESASRLAPLLFREAQSLLSTAMLTVPQPIEFFQASVILSMWSTTIGRVPLSIDSWLLSGFALQHCIASGLFQLERRKDSAISKSTLDQWCVWNHLCLVHLHYCVGTRRKAVIDRHDIEKCRVLLGSDHATNFETRMVAEVFLYWIIYQGCNGPIDLPNTQASLQSWKTEWQFLFDQSRSQFVQMGYYFAQLLTYDQSLKVRSAAVRESLLGEMVRLSTSIINVAMATADERTKHLTDHIYHMISFAAVTLLRLLDNYEDQLSSTHDLAGLDRLILTLVSWLHAVGPPCHVAHTMGDVVAAYHKKSRPGHGPSPSTSYADVDPAIHDDFAQLFPELFGTSPYALDNGSMLPEYQHIP